MSIANYISFNVFTQPDPNDSKNVKLQVQNGQHALFASGLVMDITIGVDDITGKALKEANLAIPPPITVKGLFDTGCTITSIDKDIVEILKLKTIAISQASTANGIADISIHAVSISFPGTQLRGSLVHRVGTVNLKEELYQVLIGRDLMANWNIIYNGVMGFVSISD